MSVSNDDDDSGAMTILLVEDEFFVRQDIASFFRDAGWVVKVCAGKFGSGLTSKYR